MKIGFIGNIANIMYIMASCFRTMGHNAHYYVLPSNFMFSQPFWEDNEYFVPYHELNNIQTIRQFRQSWNCPNWVVDNQNHQTLHLPLKVMKLLKLTDYLSPGILTNWHALKELVSNAYPFFRDKIKTCDWVVTRSISGLLACKQAGIPYVFIPHGQDLRDATGYGEVIHQEPFIRILTDAVREALLCGSEQSTLMQILSKLCGQDRVVTLPKMVNLDIYKPQQINPSFSFLPDKVNKILQQRDRIILFMPSRCSDRWKGTGMFLQAFQDVVLAYPKQIFLIASGWGDDFLMYRKMILANKYISESVHFLNGAISKAYMRKLLNCIDVVVDQFFIGDYGNTFIEAAACGKMVLINLDRSRWNTFTQEIEFPPVVECENREQIFNVLSDLAQRKINPNDEGNKFLEWAKRNHDMRKLVPRLVELVNKKLVAN